MVDIAGGGSQAVTLGQGQPYYFDWAPGERRMLTHVGGERLALLSLDGSETRLPGASGVFGAPQWSADGERLLYAVRDSDGQRLVLAGADGQRQRDVLPFDGQLSFSLSPDGRKIAYAITTRPVAAASFGPLSVLDLATGESTQVSTHPALGFFWSPDSRSLIYLLPADIGPQAPRRLWLPPMTTSSGCGGTCGTAQQARNSLVLPRARPSSSTICAFSISTPGA